jgi:hypothetical protein
MLQGIAAPSWQNNKQSRKFKEKIRGKEHRCHMLDAVTLPYMAQTNP